jgi:5-methyltetrahydrofolate corrinoid/iron sulfur protein methyltransferase
VFVIAENLNVMSASIAAAMKARDKAPIQDLAKRLVAAGADALDVNLGPARKDGEALMAFVVDALAEVVRCQLCLDTTNAAAMEAGIVRCAETGLPLPIVNSFSLQPDKLEGILPLAARYGCEVIGLTMETSIPVTAADRLDLAFQLVSAANEAGIGNERILIDPVVLPLGVDVGQQHAAAVREVIATLSQVFDPPVRSVCGLSNISNGAPDRLRPAINSVFLAMLAGEGLDGALVDALDAETMRTVRLVKAFRGQSLYSASDAEIQ